MNTVEKHLSQDSAAVEIALEQLFPEEKLSVFEAARYSLLGGGKRIRPALFLEFFRLCGGRDEDAMPYACGLEMIHTYSLIHDDLPCMDDDDLRRGKPANHIAFGEATALLAGDALLNRAFEVMTAARTLPAAHILDCVAYIGRMSGVYGMIGGQVLDLSMENTEGTPELLTEMVSKKTGALLRAACVAPCLLAGAAKEQVEAAEKYAYCVGLAFQIRDDMLDVMGDQAALGKRIGADAEHDKCTFAYFYGLKRCQEMVDALTSEAVQAVQTAFPGSEFLQDLAVWLAKRDH